MKKFLIFTLLLVLATAAHAGSIGFANGESCSVSAGSVNCSPVAGRGTLVIEAETAAFVKLQDVLASDWEDGVPRPCGECLVNNGFPGCTTEEDLITPTKKQLALSRLACRLRNLVVQADYKAAADTAFSGVDETPDIGGGDPQ